MNFSRQALLGIGMIVGGSVMLYAMVQQIGASEKQAVAPAMVEQAETQPAASTPLTTDIDTEKRILAQKQKERVARVAEQEKRAQQFMSEQETAETQALAKARAENQRYVDNNTPAVTETSSTDDKESVQTTVATPQVETTTASKATDEAKKADEAKRQQLKQAQQQKERQLAQATATKAQDAAEKRAEAATNQRAQAKAEADQKAATVAKTEPPKSATDHKVKAGDGLIKLAREYNVPVDVLAQANNTSPSASLRLGQTLVIPSRKQIQRLEREAATAEQARAAEKAKAEKSANDKRDAQQKLKEARKEVKETDAQGSFGVQVALASNQKSADAVAKKFKDAGYPVKTSTTSRGVRVVVGPERGKVAALALKDKVNSDSNVGASGAWVRYWD